MIGFLTSAMDKKEKVMIYYIDSKGKISQRIIRVVDIDNTKILAYCYYRKQVRSFKIDSIQSFGQLKRSVGA